VTAPGLLRSRQEASPMSRVEPKERPTPRQAARGRGSAPHIDRTPDQAEGDERTIDEALRNQEKTSK